MSNKYKELKENHQKEFDKFPMSFAFDDKQFKEGMKKLGLTEKDTDKVISIGYGGFIKKDDLKSFEEMNKKHRNEIKESIKNDKTGEGFIRDMFSYELANHEYGYTREIDDTLDALNLTYNDIHKNEKLRKGLNLVLESYKNRTIEDGTMEIIEDELDGEEF